MKVSRRKFFELAGAAAGVAALPRAVVEGIVPPAPVPAAFAPAIEYTALEEIVTAERVLDAVWTVYGGLPYWNVADHVGVYAGIKRS